MVTNQPRSDVQPTDHDPASSPTSPLPEGRADGTACGDCQRTAEAMRIASAGNWSGMVSELLGYLHEAGTDGLPLDAVTVHDYVRELKERYVTAPVRAALAVPVVAVPEAGEREALEGFEFSADKGPYAATRFAPDRSERDLDEAWRHASSADAAARGFAMCSGALAADLTDAERAEMVTALDDLNGPVGVREVKAILDEHPEPDAAGAAASLASWQFDPPQHERYQDSDPNGDYYDGPPPAVPVVHPEPGDRADVGTEFVQQVEAIERGDMDEPLAEWEETLLREDRWLATIWPTYPNGRLRSDEHNLKLARSIMALADAEVAAAVAAVRADTVAQIDSLDTWLAVQEFFMTDSPWYDPRKGLSRLRALLGAETPGVQPLGQTGQRAGQTRRTGPAEEPE